MSRRILLSTYYIKIQNKAGFDQVLSRFNSTDDLLPLIQKFTIDLLSKPKPAKDINNKSIYLGMKGPAILDDRVLYGYFKSGVSGENFSVSTIADDIELLEVNSDEHASYREVFFYFYLPSNSKEGYLVLQRGANYGVKLVLRTLLTKYIKGLGYLDSNLYINNVVHSKVFDKMINSGRLKRIDFVRNEVPDTIEEFLSRETNTDTEGLVLKKIKGQIRTSIKATDLTDSYKNFIKYIFIKRQQKDAIVEIIDDTDGYDEIEFELELNGKQKTFYVNKQARVQPDVDVTSDIDFEPLKGRLRPRLTSLISKARELVDEIIDFKKNVP